MAITSESEPRVPTDLRKVLAASAGAKAQWSDLTPIARRDFISWIETAKTTRDPQTPCREHPFEARLRQAAPLLLCIRAHESYKSIGSLPKAKAQWKDLTPNERRDFVDWIDSAKESDMRTQRIEKVCVMLLSGKRHP